MYMSIEILIPAAIVLLVLCVMAAFFVSSVRRRRAIAFVEELLASGQPAPATIISAKDGSVSGEHGSGRYRKDIRLVLEVHPPGQSAFQAMAIGYDVSISEAVRPGQTLLVKYNPENKSTVAVDPSILRKLISEVSLDRVLEYERCEEAALDTLKRVGGGKPETRE
jgi:hypothetical protein